MATGGFEVESEKTRLMEKTDDQDDGDADERGNETTGFEPGSSSTPAPNGNQRQTTMNRPGEQPSFIEFPDSPGLSTTTHAKNVLLKYCPNFDENNIKYKIDDKGRLEIGLASPKKRYIRFLTKIQGKDEYQINNEITKEVRRFLGEIRLESIPKEIQSLSEEINNNKKIIDDPFENRNEKNKARERLKRIRQKQTSLERELDQLKKGNFSLPSESIELETFQKNDAVREERYQEKERQKEEKNQIANDKNRPSAERESAREDAEEIQQEQNEILNEREREIEQLPLRDRLREKVKAIFKKYGFTVGAVFLAVGTTLGVLLSSLSNGLKAVSKGVGNGLKTLGKKIADILPGLIGAVVSFVFRTAGNVVGFLGKHAWLLILAVAAFLFERVMKGRG